MVLYTDEGQGFGQHVHPRLKRRIKMLMVIGGLMLVVVIYDMMTGTLGVVIGIASIIVGSVIGFFSSRIWHLSWDRNGDKVVGRIDTIGWIVLAAYVIFEIARSLFFQDVVHLGEPTALTFAFVSAALIARIFGLRGRILKVLKDEKILG
jgi:hypothetical protein